MLLWLLWSILWLMDLAEWTLYDWLLQLFDYRCPITVNCPITLSDYNCTEWLVKNEAADAPITFEEIVMVMIRHQNMVWASATHSALLCMLFCSHHLVTPISDLLLNKRMAIWSLFVNIISNLQIKIESLLHKIKIKIIPRVTFNRCWSILYHSSSKFVHSSLLDGTCHIHTLLSPISSSKLLFFF